MIGGVLSEEGITLGELVRSVSALVTQVSKLSDKLDESREDIARRFDDLGLRYVLRELHVKDVAELHARQDNYQRQTDVALMGVEDELRKVEQEAVQRETDRKVELERIATQRHNDRMQIGLALLALAGAILIALLPQITS